MTAAQWHSHGNQGMGPDFLFSLSQMIAGQLLNLEFLSSGHSWPTVCPWGRRLQHNLQSSRLCFPNLYMAVQTGTNSGKFCRLCPTERWTIIAMAPSMNMWNTSLYKKPTNISYKYFWQPCVMPTMGLNWWNPDDASPIVANLHWVGLE